MKIVDVRRAEDEEMPDHWQHYRGPNPVVLELANGHVLIPAQDPELNGPGHLLGYDGDGFFDVRPKTDEDEEEDE